MNNMNIEDFNNKQFDIFGTTFTIKLVDTLDADDNLLHYGLTKGSIREIRISTQNTILIEITVFCPALASFCPIV